MVAVDLAISAVLVLVNRTLSKLFVLLVGVHLEIVLQEMDLDLLLKVYKRSRTKNSAFLTFTS